MCLPLAKRQAIEQPAKFSRGNHNRSFRAGWPLESPSLKTAVKKPKAVMVPKQKLQFVSVTITKHKEAILEGIDPELLLNEGS